MSICVLSLNNQATAYSCKVEVPGKDTIFSENCVKQNDGKVLVHYCNKSGKCIAEKALPAKGYRCQKKSPGTPSFCVYVKKDILLGKVNPIKKYDTNFFSSIENDQSNEYKIEVNDKAELLQFQQQLASSSSQKKNEQFIVHIKTDDSTLLCSFNSEKLYKISTNESIPNCNENSNANNESTYPKSDNPGPTSKKGN